MRILLIVSIVVFITGFGATNCLAQATDLLREIVPLKTTRTDFERRFGAPLEPACDDCTYNSPEARILVRYSRGPCLGGSVNGWNVPKGTVISATIFPSGSEPAPDPEQIGAGPVLFLSSGTFVLPRQGLVYSIDAITKTTKYVSILPGDAKDEMRCPGFPLYNPAGSLYSPSDAFEKAEAIKTLDLLAVESEVIPSNAMYYVVVYAGKGMTAKEYRRLVEGYESHLYDRRRVSPTKVRLINGGWRDRFTGHVFYLRVDDPPPVASPSEVRN